MLECSAVSHAWDSPRRGDSSTSDDGHLLLEEYRTQGRTRTRAFSLAPGFFLPVGVRYDPRVHAPGLATSGHSA